MKGHPILGIISGFLFGLFLGIALFLYGVLPLNSSWLWILPLLGILLGLVMAVWAPFGKGPEPAPTATTLPPASSAPAPPPPPVSDSGPTGDDPPTS